MLRRHALGLGASAILATPTLVRAQGAAAGYPDRPIRFIVPFPAGGGTDTWARIAAEPMQAELGQPIIIDNRGGAGGMVGTEYAAKVPPDGYQLLFTITTHIQSPVVMNRFPYDPVADFAPIGRLGTTAVNFVVGPKVPASVTTLAEFVAWAQGDGGREVSIANYAPGSTGHAFGLTLAREARLNATQVSYRGEAPMLQDILAGTVDGGFHSMAAAGEMVRARRVRPLAASGARRSPSLPDVPTLVELGYSNRFIFDGFSGLMAPARTPRPIVERLVAAFRKAAEAPVTHERLLRIDTVPSYLGPDEFGSFVAAKLREWTEIAQELNLRVES
jgi:tripartite-type tricarboxylate transporter receptor subunit TctC